MTWVRKYSFSNRNCIAQTISMSLRDVSFIADGLCRYIIFHSLVIQLKIEEDKAPTLPAGTTTMLLFHLRGRVQVGTSLRLRSASALAKAPFCHGMNIYRL